MAETLFDKLIHPFPKEFVREAEIKRRNKPSNRSEQHEDMDVTVAKNLELLNAHYNYLKYWFAKISSFPENSITYDEKDRQIKLKGSGIAIFSIYSEPKYFVDEKTGLKRTVIPVRNDFENCNLTVFEQIDVGMHNKIEVNYLYETSVNLMPKPSTTNVYTVYSSNEKKYFFFEKNGRIYYRCGDATLNSLEEGIFGCLGFFTYPDEPKYKRAKLHLQGEIIKILPDKEFSAYKGYIKSDGIFPFVYKNFDSKHRTPKTNPATPELLKV